MIDETFLRQKVRQLIRSGRLPARRPGRMWGGPGGGQHCTLCGIPVGSEELALEVEFARDDGGERVTRHFHMRCFSAIESEFTDVEPVLPSSRIGATQPAAGSPSNGAHASPSGMK